MVRIKRECAKKPIGTMKSGKAAEPSGIVAEMSKASGETGIDLVTELAISIVNEGMVPANWEVDSIVNIYFCKLQGIEHVMEVIERIVEMLVREKVNIDDMQFGFMPGRGTTDAIILVRQYKRTTSANRKSYILHLLTWRRQGTTRCNCGGHCAN